MAKATPASRLVPPAVSAIVAAFLLIAAMLLPIGHADYPDLHTILDTGMALLSAILALLLWDMGEYLKSPLPRWFALSFATTFALELAHVLVTVEWAGMFAPIRAAKTFLRPLTWPPASHVLPIGLIAALWCWKRGVTAVAHFAIAIAMAGAGLFFLFQQLPAYTPPTLLGITRPVMVGAPLLWVVVGILAQKWRWLDRLIQPLVWSAIPLFLANVVMLYSRAPADAPAMVAHLGKIAGYLLLLLLVMQIASRDMRDRIVAENQLIQINKELDQRVLERTSELASANAALEQEMAVSRQAETRANAQLERLYLLHQITRAIGERQDLASIFQVVVRAVETQLPADFACLFSYDDVDSVLTVNAVGANSEPLALALAMPERARIAIDENGLSRCVRGHLVYEPDIAELDFPFPKRLAGGGLRSLVMSPLQVEDRIFGVLAVARFAPESFVSGECEFLRQLSEHTALAAHQARLHTALQQAYDDLRQSQQAAMQQDRLRALGQMASGIAHDINNALSPVSLYTEVVLETETNLSRDGRGYLEVIRRALADVAHTIGRMRDFYREREPELLLVPLDVNQLVRQVLDLTKARWSDMAMQRGIVIRPVLELEKNAPFVAGIASELREALTNLILNAVDAMPDGGVLTLRTKARADAKGYRGSVDLEVQDEGIGMDEETRRRCLDPFFTTKGERGTGLGLAMVYGAIQRHGAELTIDTAPGRGTCVRLSFPMAANGVETTNGNAGIAAVEPMRLLLVDDDPVPLKALGSSLQRDGHQVTLADGGRVGIDAFQSALADDEPFDLVITDLGMPYVDGRQVAAEIKALSARTPIILLTGWGEGLKAEPDRPHHVDQILGKPPKLREIREALSDHGRSLVGEMND
jgi:signal transduction histidine kinase/ActR/RegA family two-component response regulator